jgi:uncharacterized membrane protein
MDHARMQDQWSNYRKRQRLFYLSIPAVVLVGLASSFLANASASPWIFFALTGVSVVAMVVAANYVFFFKCPNCNARFASSWFWRNPFAHKCVHCGEVLGSDT